ncbi:unnamed protein product [Mycena citricolor]|uniref:Cation/H+ exchanger transmembrane domain-containing protein n=1 Tax=Mycena citricolor TaxID=2018698 RepID=A0AAD2HJ50_9AGAR|nr:unnamed protein product [Mycena citricolor]
MTLLRKNLALSSAIALTGTAMPIFLSIVLLHYGFKYGTLESFASGAALSSTSLGTTMALLKPEWRATVAGTALMTAALLDDVCGLVIAAVLSQLAGASVVIPWYIIARPILVSLAFAIGTFFAALSLGCLFRWYPVKLRNKSLLFIMIALLTGYVAGSHYAGTSELFGAYLAGALLAYIFPRDGSLSAFETHIRPILHVFLSPVFFASIGMALPIRALGSINGSNRVVWRGIVYSMLMGLAKFCSALWMLVWRTDVRSAVLVGFGMIARGEVALIVTQLALPLLSTEAYAVVTWATLLNTAGGAILVGCFLRRVAEIE